MNKQETQTDQRANEQEQMKKTSEQQGKQQTSSQGATEKAKAGEPLTADKQRDRSPKQENL